MSTKTQAPHTAPQAGSTQQGVEPPARFDWMQVVRHMLFACLCGVVCGFASIALCLFVGAARHLFERAPWLIWLLPVMGVLQLFMYKWWKLPLNLTTDAVIEKMRAGDHLSALLAPGILFSTGMTILAGGSVGKEAGALQIGASLGTTIARPFGLHNILRREHHDDTPEVNRYIASTGMAAAFSALFFAPLGSCMLVLELMRFTQLQYVISMLVSCFIAFLISNHFGIGDVIGTVPVPVVSWRIIGVCIIIGIAAAVGGSVFAIAIRLLQALTMRIRRNYFVWVIAGGLLFAVLVSSLDWWRFTGSGGELLNMTLNMPDVSFDFAIKMLLTVICLGMWFKGGEIMPSFCIGGLLGAACFAMTGTDPLFGTALGSICFLAAFNRCPMSAVLLGCEIFGWGMFPFLAVGVAIAFLFGYPVGMYGASIDVLARSGWHRFFSNVRASVISNEVRDDAGFTDFVMAAGTALHRVAGSAVLAAESEEIRERRRRHQCRHVVRNDDPRRQDDSRHGDGHGSDDGAGGRP
ncbi:chloride channel protein [Bifidobacterium pseudolongum]|uniref:Voltage gated chloride channel family protein n=1 Tax=Bifidobacterium pseudolongum subsp. globosum TaxID=1690 RepID=A0A2N3R451_9BIFI|nr:chloride channel protein [Bifidobacterium pseudolongum]PKV03101.1 voltage gated chloride channel family protein [Bifidobacterium pseudolongum subsp. globosum]